MNTETDISALVDPGPARPRELRTILLPLVDEMEKLGRVIDGLIQDDAARYFPEAGALCRGGKRLRGAICVASARALTAESSRLDRAIEVAAYIEGIHFSSLLHDDVIDHASERRGIATLHRKYGRTGAILAGDILYIRIFNRLIEIDRDGLMKTVTHGTAEMVEGETLETLCATMGRVPSRRDYLKCISKKTAAFFGAAARAGAIIALPSNGSAHEEAHDAMYRYGHELGMAFQIVDDLLDWTAEQNELGKDLQSDIRNGKITLPALLFLEDEPTLAAALIEEARGTDSSSLRDILAERGYFTRTREIARDYARNSLLALDDAGTDDPLLHELVEFSLYRYY